MSQLLYFITFRAMDISLLIQQIKKLQDDIKAIQVSVKDLAPKPEGLEALKMKRREMSKQIKEMEEDIERDMNEDEDIMEFKKEKVAKEEKLAEVRKDLFQELSKMNQDFNLSVQCEDGVVKAQGIKAMRCFMNGKEVVNKGIIAK